MRHPRAAKRAAATKRATATTATAAAATAAAAAAHNCLSCVDCQKMFSIPDEFRVYIEDNFPSVWHCSYATWDLKLHKLCKIRAKRLADDNDDEAKRHQRAARGDGDVDNAGPPRKMLRTKRNTAKTAKTKVKARYKSGLPSGDEAPELLIKGFLSERLQMKVLLQLGVLAEQERKRKLRAAYFPSKRKMVQMQEKQTESRSALCFHCKSACSHSKLSLKMDLTDLGMAEEANVKDTT